jgi:hypothetical protein
MARSDQLFVLVPSLHVHVGQTVALKGTLAEGL